MEINKNKKRIVIGSKNYSVNISLLHGGTIRSLHIRDWNTRLKREGCEYWEDGNNHYEQEFGHIKNIDIKENKKVIKINLKASMRMPGSKKYGGDTITKYLFDENKIIVESIIEPIYDVRCYDKYVCFKQNTFTGYSIKNDNGTTNCPDDLSDYYDMPDTIFRAEFENNNEIKLTNGINDIIINSPNAMIRIYKTRRMLEVKPNWKYNKNNDSMIMEYII